MWQVQDTYNWYKACMSPLQGYKEGTRHLQWVQGRYETPTGEQGGYDTPTRGTRQV